MWKKISEKKFFKLIDGLTFKSKDFMEAKMFGCNSVKECYTNVRNKLFNEYYVICDNRTNDVLAPIILQRDGFLVFFVTKDLTSKNALQFVKDIKDLALKTISRVGSIMVNTANFYKEAHKLNRLIGFKPISYKDRYTVFALTKTQEN